MSKKILLLILSFIILQSLFVNAVSPSMPMPIGIKLTNDCIPLSNFKICVENERTMERICELTNDNGEQIFNLANFEKSYSYGDLIKIIYCIDTPICEETYLIQKIESNVGGYNFLRDVSEDNIKKGSKTFIIMCTDDFAVDYLNVSLKYEGRIILNKIIEGQGRQLNYKLNLTVPIGLEHEFIAECVDTSGNKKVSKEYFLINNKEDENEPLIIYVNNTIFIENTNIENTNIENTNIENTNIENTNIENTNIENKDITNIEENNFIKLIINNKIIFSFFSFGGISIAIYLIIKRLRKKNEKKK